MKKYTVVLLLFMFQIPLLMADNSRFISFTQLPDTIQKFVSKCYGDQPIHKIKQTSTRYKIYFQNYDEITFSMATNNWIDAESLNALPVPLLATLPKKILEYLIEYYDGVPVVELERMNNNWIGLELTTGEDILFNADGLFIQTNYGSGLNDPNRNITYP